MKAVMIEKYGGTEVLGVCEVPRPSPAAHQVLIEVHACSINPIDAKIRSGAMSFRTGKRFPMGLGFDASGVVVESGREVKDFHVGDEVYARTNTLTGGAYAQYLVLDQEIIAHKLPTISHKEAAAVPLAALTALQGLRDDCQLRAGQRVLIIGASGGVGSYAVQIAKALGAYVVAVASTGNLDLLQSLGADEVIDYTKNDVLKTEKRYHCIFDVVGSQRFGPGRRALVEQGRYAAAVPSLGVVFAMFVANAFRQQKARFVMCQSSGRDLAILNDWILQGKLVSIIDSCFTLEQIESAHQRIESQRTKGKIVLDMMASNVAQS